MKVSSLHCCLTFYLPENFLSLSSFSFFFFFLFFQLINRHTHQHTQNSPQCEPISSPPVHLPGKIEPQTKKTQANSVIWIKWQEEEGSRGRKEWWVPGSTGDAGDRGVGWWREARGAWCGFFLTGWSLLWADPLPAGSRVSWMCAGWGRVEKRRYKQEQWTMNMEIPYWLSKVAAVIKSKHLNLINHEA